MLVIIAQITFAGNPIKNDQTDLVKLRKHLISQIGFPSKIKNADGKQVTVFFEINVLLKSLTRVSKFTHSCPFKNTCKLVSNTNNMNIQQFILS